MIGSSLASVFSDSTKIWQSFTDTYDFFPEIFHSGWLIAILLSLVGVLIVARSKIFIGAAITQTSTFGISIALYIIGLEGMSDATGQAKSELILFYSILAACLCTFWAFVNKSFFWSLLQKLRLPIRASKESEDQSKEDITAWLFLLSSAGSIVLLSKSPVGKEVIDKLIFSTIIGAEQEDVKTILGLLICGAILLFLFVDKLTLVFTDRDYAISMKMPATLIEFGFALFAGISLGACLKVSGTLYTFGCLILPVLIAANFVRSTRILFLLAPIAAFSFSFLGFALGNFYDIPQTQFTVFCMAIFYPISLIYKSLFIRN
ncbi:MAG: metal ABC transporter permease [Lentisphaeraceae bacterium]|nr:metal ABC transporter permease [Lentisphaeraceae bacterium]